MKLDMMVTVLSCAGRDVDREWTVASLKKSDLGVDPLVVMDKEAIEDRGLEEDHRFVRPVIAQKYVLQKFLESDHQILVSCEDDVEVSPHIRHNIETWGIFPARYPVASLFHSPGVQVVRDLPEYNALEAGSSYFGAQCLVYTREGAKLILDHWVDVPRTQVGTVDGQVGPILWGQRRLPLLIHCPGLVTHRPTGTPSSIWTWSKKNHIVEQTFDTTFKRTESWRQHLNTIMGFFSAEEAGLLYDTALRSGGMMMAECGSYQGKSTSVLGAAAKITGGRVYAVDFWENSGVYGSDWPKSNALTFSQNMQRAGVLEQVYPLRLRTPAAAPVFRDGVLDLFFHDAGHTEAEITEDLNAWLPKLRSGGWLLVHDYGNTAQGWDQVIPAMQKFLSQLRGDTFQLVGSLACWQKV